MHISALNIRMVSYRVICIKNSILVFLLIDKSDSQSKLDRFNLHEELKKILFVHKKEKLHICANQVQFQFSISCFHNYEVNYIRTCTYVYCIIYVCVFVCIYVSLSTYACTINFLGSDKKRLT